MTSDEPDFKNQQLSAWERRMAERRQREEAEAKAQLERAAAQKLRSKQESR